MAPHMLAPFGVWVYSNTPHRVYLNTQFLTVFPLLLGATTGNLSQSFIDTFSVGFMTLATPTHYRTFNSQGPPTRECSSGLKAA